MQLIFIAQTQLCLVGSGEINFCSNFEHHDLIDVVTATPQIWYNTPTTSEVQDPTFESTKNTLKIDSYLHLCKGVVLHSFGSWRSKKHKEL